MYLLHQTYLYFIFQLFNIFMSACKAFCVDIFFNCLQTGEVIILESIKDVYKKVHMVSF